MNAQGQIDDDYALALQLQASWNAPGDPTGHVVGDNVVPSGSSVRAPSKSAPLSVIDPEWELLDPNPDARALFMEFNKKYFWGKLDGVEVRWSPRMTL